MTKWPLHICDDWIVCNLPDLPTLHRCYTGIKTRSDWLEIVPGLDSLAVQFDPSIILPDEAAAELQKQLATPGNMQKPSNPQTIEIPVCYDAEFAPDRNHVAEKLRLAPDNLPLWHSDLQFTVAMLGFLPGFGYLQCKETVAEIGRLKQPHQSVAAGSIGIIGDQSCIYSFDSPGGWPIIGRTPVLLFDRQSAKPNLLEPGLKISFSPISRRKFDAIHSGRESWV